MTDSVELYEYLARRFHEDVGLMAPGKDAPAGRYTDEQDAERQPQWELWLAQNGTEERKRFPIVQRIEKMARTVWPDAAELSVHITGSEALISRSSHGCDACVVVDDYREDSRSLLALESAVCVLSEELTPVQRELVEHRNRLLGFKTRDSHIRSQLYQWASFEAARVAAMGPIGATPALLAPGCALMVLEKLAAVEKELATLRANLEKLAEWCETSEPLYSARNGTVTEERRAAGKRIRNELIRKDGPDV